MAKFVPLTDPVGNTVMVNPEHVRLIKPRPNGEFTDITFSGADESLTVKGDGLHVVRLLTARD